MGKITVDENFCEGCGLCIDACPKKIMALDMEKMTDKGYHPAMCIDMEACIACKSCALMCPDCAITVEK